MFTLLAKLRVFLHIQSRQSVKKLHALVLKSFVGPFFLTFFIALFVLLMQFLWKYIDDLVGKGLDGIVIAELLFYTAANLVPLALPLAILVSSIMTFGNMAEHFELTAAKAAGISLQRIMLPLFITAFLISGLAFFFSNNILPYTNLKMGSLLYDIRQQKPALSIREGVFYNGIEGYSIKVGEKGKDGKTIRKVMIYDHTGGMGNRKVVMAESGKMESTDDQKFLILTLFNGTSYEEQNKNKGGIDTHPLMRNAFKEYIIRFDLSQFKLNRTNEDLFKGGHQMMNLSQLNEAVDSLTQDYDKKEKLSTVHMQPYFLMLRDSSRFDKGITTATAIGLNDSMPSFLITQVFDNAMNQARSMQTYLTGVKDERDSRMYQMSRFKVEWHRKLTLSAACFILFLIGAPLGAIIRKGGLGLPLVISILFFLAYHITSITGEKFAKESIIPAWRGMWLSSFILLPIGIFLIYKATHDSVIFDGDAYRNLFKIFRKKKKSNLL
ncbi:MAG: LptF/LptG family permease [Bacteroidetes bacterium]|jgi:lipopolysaccharide export system permease protein|nr:LptF/LptG family permease [Bacteroidota bacterium]